MEAPTLRLIVSGTPEVAALQALHLLCAEFVQLTKGVPPGDNEAESLLTDLPPGKTLSDKLVFGIFRAREMLGVVELLRDYPEPRAWYIGLLLLVPDARGAGLGTAIVEEVVARIAEQRGTSIHLIALEDNPRAVAFWRRHGFEEIDKRIQDLGTKKNVVHKMIRRLSATAGVARQPG